MAMSVLQIVQASCKELGLPVPTTVSGAQDIQATQLYALLNSLGQTLITAFHWQRIQRTHTFDTVIGQAEYKLPDDWDGPLDQTEWNRSNHWPLIGQMTPQGWAWLENAIVSIGPYSKFRYHEGFFNVFPTPTAIYTFSYQYLSNAWVYLPNAPDVRYNITTRDEEVTIFTDRLMIAGVKLKFWQIKGFDTKALQDDYDAIYNQNMGRDQGAAKLSLSPRPSFRYIGVQNVPDGNWPQNAP